LKLIVGLGNPSSKYELNRHNVGFLIADYLVNSLNLSFTASKGEWYGCEGTYQGNDFYLMKPTTFMNNSGKAVNDFLSIHEIPLKNLLIIGIGGEEIVTKENYVNHVLSNFEKDELERIKTLMPFYKDCILSFISEDIKDTMNKFNKNYLSKEATEEKTEEESKEESKEEPEEET